jgi:hypothetical protein
MMADNKEKSVCVELCFLLGSEQSLTENKTSRTLFVHLYVTRWSDSICRILVDTLKNPSFFDELKSV